MKPQLFALLLVLPLAAILLLWPRASHQTPSADSDRPHSTADGGVPAIPSREVPRRNGSEHTPQTVRAPEAADMRLSPESPPEQTLQWRIARQEAMLRTLDRHLESSETKLRIATDPAERETLRGQLDILRAEWTNQQTILRKLQE